MHEIPEALETLEAPPQSPAYQGQDHHRTCSSYCFDRVEMRKSQEEHSFVFLAMSPGYKCSVPASNDEGVAISNSANSLPSMCQPPHAVTCNGKIDSNIITIDEVGADKSLSGYLF